MLIHINTNECPIMFIKLGILTFIFEESLKIRNCPLKETPKFDHLDVFL
jgi:hypothetical protein